MGRVDIITGTLGKALGGRARRLHQRRGARSSSCCASARGPISSRTRCRRRWSGRASRCSTCSRDHRAARQARGATRSASAPAMTRRRVRASSPASTRSCPIMLYDERLAHDMARRLLEQGIYVIGFSFPVVPKGQARIRVQLSAAHEPRAHRPRGRGVHRASGGRWACSRRRRAAPDRIEPGSARRSGSAASTGGSSWRGRRAAPARRRPSGAPSVPSPRSGAARKRATATPAPQSARLGLITHTELVSADPAATQAWCAKVLGWKFAPPMPTPTGPYRMWRFAKQHRGGIRANNPSEMPGSIPFCEVKSIRTAFDQRTLGRRARDCSLRRRSRAAWDGSPSSQHPAARRSGSGRRSSGGPIGFR